MKADRISIRYLISFPLFNYFRVPTMKSFNPSQATPALGRPQRSMTTANANCYAEVS